MTRVSTMVVEQEIDRKIQNMESLVDKYDSATLIDTDLTDSFEFPALKRQVYIENYATEAGQAAARFMPEFRGIQQSTILNLRNLPVFRITGATMQCKKILLSRIQNGSLWMGKEIPIHVEYIHKLTGLSQEGRDVSSAFQTVSKRAKKSRDTDYYVKYDTRRGGKGVKIKLINRPEVKFACYLIASKTMRHYTKGECTLDRISVAKHCVQGKRLNWCSFLLK